MKGVAVFNKWFRCPGCAGRNVLWSANKQRYTCRKCGTIFVADHQQRKTSVAPGDAKCKLGI